MEALRIWGKSMEMLEKSDLRRRIKKQRQELKVCQEAAWNLEICRKVLGLEEIRRAFCVYCYISFHHEAGTGRLIEALLEMGKYVAVPKVVGKDLEFYSITGNGDLEEGAMGIMEPKSTCLKVWDTMAPVVVPGIAFDPCGHRVGYGGGYYDRFFEQEPGHKKLAIAYDFQVFEAIPAGHHDKSVDLIITPGGIKKRRHHYDH